MKQNEKDLADFVQIILGTATAILAIVAAVFIIYIMITGSVTQQHPSSDYVTRDEVHQIVDSILTEIYD